MITVGDIRQLAGLLEGEGCFYFNKVRGNVCIQLQMTDQDVVEWAARILGTRVRSRQGQRQNCKRQFITQASGLKATGWMMVLYQFLGKRRKGKIREILCLWKLRKPLGKFRMMCARGHRFDAFGKKDNRGNRICVICSRENSVRYRQRLHEKTEANAVGAIA